MNTPSSRQHLSRENPGQFLQPPAQAGFIRTVDGGYACQHCGKVNRVFTRYCGSCGKLVGAVRALPGKAPSAVPKLRETNQETVEETVSGFPFKENSFLSQDPKPQRNSAVSAPVKAVPGAAKANNRRASKKVLPFQTKGRVIRRIAGGSTEKKSNSYESLLKGAAVLFLFLGFGSVVFAFYLKKPFRQLWAAQACVKADSKDIKGEFRFADVPLGHPAYRSWKPLIKLGISLADEFNAANPYSDIKWDSWRKIVLTVASSYPWKDGGMSAVPPSRSGIMKTSDVEQSLLALRKAWGLPKTSFSSCAVSSPTRMEAFSALGSLVDEKCRFLKR